MGEHLSVGVFESLLDADVELEHPLLGQMFGDEGIECMDSLHHGDIPLPPAPHGGVPGRAGGRESQTPACRRRRLASGKQTAFNFGNVERVNRLIIVFPARQARRFALAQIKIIQ